MNYITSPPTQLSMNLTAYTDYYGFRVKTALAPMAIEGCGCRTPRIMVHRRQLKTATRQRTRLIATIERRHARPQRIYVRRNFKVKHALPISIAATDAEARRRGFSDFSASGHAHKRAQIRASTHSGVYLCCCERFEEQVPRIDRLLSRGPPGRGPGRRGRRAGGLRRVEGYGAIFGANDRGSMLRRRLMAERTRASGPKSRSGLAREP